jgi:AraC-like DNA-binding protein
VISFIAVSAVEWLPKWVIRRTRLQEVALRVEHGEVTTLAALAAELGYTDQAHLARDFKTAVGKSPSEFGVTVWR